MITALYYELYYRMTKASRLHDESGIERRLTAPWAKKPGSWKSAA